MKILKVVSFLLVIAIVAALGMQAGLSVEAARSEEFTRQQENMTTKIALVNQDIGVENGGEWRNYASAVIEEMTKAYPDHYVMVSKQTAQAGYESGAYAAVITFPSNLSERVASLNAREPQIVTVDYKVSSVLPEEKYIDTYINLLNFEHSLNQSIVYMYVDALYQEFHSAQNQMGTLLENDQKDMTVAKSVAMGNYAEQIDFGELPSPAVEFIQADITAQIQDVQASGQAISQAYWDSYAQADSGYDSAKVQLLNMIRIAGVEKVPASSLPSESDPIRLVDREAPEKSVTDKTDQVCWLLPGGNLKDEDGGGDDWIVPVTDGAQDAYIAIVDEKSTGAKEGELVLPKGGVLTTLSGGEASTLPPGTLISPNGNVYFTVKLEFKRSSNEGDFPSVQMVRVQRSVDFIVPEIPRKDGFASGYVFTKLSIGKETFLAEEFEPDIEQPETKQDETAQDEIKPTETGQTSAKPSGTESRDSQRKDMIKSSELEAATKPVVVTYHYRNRGVDPIRAYDRDDPQNLRPLEEAYEGFLLPGSNGKDEFGAGDDWVVLGAEDAYIARTNDTGIGAVRGDLVLPNGGNISKVNGLEKQALPEGTVLKANYPGQFSDNWKAEDMLAPEEGPEEGDSAQDSSWVYVKYGLGKEEKLTEEQMQDLLIQMMTLIDNYSPRNYLTTQTENQVERAIFMISSALHAAQSDMGTAQSHNIAVLNEIHRTYNEYITGLREQTTQTYTLEQEELTAALGSFMEQKRDTSNLNQSLIADFSVKLPYSRIGSMTNENVVQFTSGPIQYVNSQIRETVTTNDGNRQALQQGLWYMVMGLGGACLLLLLTMLALYIRRNRRDEE